MLKKVIIESDALLVCMAHALSTEKEEVMGLLIGEISEEGTSHIHAAIMLRRLDKRKDRVEISPEQLSNASTQAEYELGLRTRAMRPMRIVGWYHSHPHITVWPSHVDVRTQAMYQLMDRDFIGLIVSCFNEDCASLGQMQVTCFQSINESTADNPRFERLEIPQQIVPCDSMSKACLHALTSFPKILMEEESDSYAVSLSYRDQDLITAVQNASVFTKAVMQIIEIICSPLLQSMENRLELDKQNLRQLINKRDFLRRKASNINGHNEMDLT